MNKFILLIFAVLIVIVCALGADTYNKSKHKELIQTGNAKDDQQLLVSGDSALAVGDKEKAMVNYILLSTRGENTGKEDPDSVYVIANCRIGDIYFAGGNYSSALDFYLKGLTLSERNSKKPFIADLYKNIGNVYCVFKDYEKGISQYQIGLKYSQSNPAVAVKICQNLMGAYVSIHKLKEARAYYEYAQKIPYNYDVIGEFMNGYIEGLLLQEEGKYEEAIDRFYKMASFANEHNIDPKYECSAYEELYKSYQKIGNRDSTLYYIKKCNNLAEGKGLIHMFTDTFRHLADVHESLGHTQEALHLRSKFLEMQDSIFDTREFDIVKNQQFIYEMSKTEKEINTLHEKEILHSVVIKWQRIVIAIAVVAVVIVILLLVSVYKKKHNIDISYRNLFQLNQQLTETHHAAMERQKRLQEEVALKETQLDELRRKSPNDDEGELKASPVKYRSSCLNEGRQAELLNKITEEMEENKVYCNEDFSLDSLALLVGSNSRYVSQAINEEYGKNFSNYVNEYRIRLACERLSNKEEYGNFTIKAIGESVGFKSHTTFITVFKKTTGITPSIYLKLAKEQS